MGTTGTKIKNGIVNILYPKKSIRDQFKDNTLLIGIETILIQIKIINILYINIIFNKNKLINLFNNTKMAMAQAD